MKLTIKNYRCFPDSDPVRLSLRPGFTSFIGINNSGKSALLKFFYELRHMFDVLANVNTIMQLLRGNRASFVPPASVSDLPELFCNLNNRDLTIEISDWESTEESPHGAPQMDAIAITVYRNTSEFTASVSAGKKAVRTNTNYSFSETTVFEEGTAAFDFSAFTIACSRLYRTLYIGAFRNILNVGTNQNYFDIVTGQAFVENWRVQKTGNEKRQVEAIYRLTEEIRSIFGYANLQIDPSLNNETLQLLIDGRMYKLPEIGSGITQFILVLANAAIQEPELILIDEPELNLHPSLQLDFLTTLGAYARSGVLYSTHSIGLARAAADRVYSVGKISEGHSRVSIYEDTPALSEFLGELNYSGYRELGFDRVLLVEGTSEVKTIQQFLRLLKKDHETVLLPLGGASLISGNSESELEEIGRISDNVSALIDSERTGPSAAIPKDRIAFQQACKKAGIQCHVLDRRATENYFPEAAIQKVKGSKYRALQPFEKLGDVEPSWGKNENWRIAREMTTTDLVETDLGVFLKAL